MVGRAARRGEDAGDVVLRRAGDLVEVVGRARGERIGPDGVVVGGAGLHEERAGRRLRPAARAAVADDEAVPQRAAAHRRAGAGDVRHEVARHGGVGVVGDDAVLDEALVHEDRAAVGGDVVADHGVAQDGVGAVDADAAGRAVGVAGDDEPPGRAAHHIEAAGETVGAGVPAPVVVLDGGIDEQAAVLLDLAGAVRRSAGEDAIRDHAEADVDGGAEASVGRHAAAAVPNRDVAELRLRVVHVHDGMLIALPVEDCAAGRVGAHEDDGDDEVGGVDVAVVRRVGAVRDEDGAGGFVRGVDRRQSRRPVVRRLLPGVVRPDLGACRRDMDDGRLDGDETCARDGLGDGARGVRDDEGDVVRAVAEGMREGGGRRDVVHAADRPRVGVGRGAAGDRGREGDFRRPATGRDVGLE